MILGQRMKVYLLRIKNASFPELLHRVWEAILTFRLRACFDKGGIGLKIPVLDLGVIEALHLPDFQYHVNDQTLSSLLAGGVFALNGDGERIARFEEESRGVFFADVSQAEPGLDIRMAWEPARLQHLTILLLYAATNRGLPDAERLQENVKGAILEWIKQNPFLSGPHYQSAMECGLRIPVFFYVLKILNINLDLSEKSRILETIYQHAWWIFRRLSLYSSLGNHTVCECVGLVFAGAIFSPAPEGQAWMRRGLALLRQELHHQILNDGGPTEQSLGYGRFVLDLYWLVIGFLEKNSLHDCTDFKPRLLLGEGFLTACQDDQGQLPAIGDCDDGYAVAPGMYPGKPIDPDQLTYKTFPSAGYTVIRGGDCSILTFDHGPLGMPPLYNHGHADALSITLSVNGRAMLVDPGTYRYNGVPEFRRYFKGTRSHNTVMVDGEDQAVQETGFIWSQPFRATLVRAAELSDGIIFEGHHDGYARLKNPVEHQRSIFFFRGRHFLIRDTFSGVGIHDFELNYHIHPDATVDKRSGWWVMEHRDEAVFIQLLTGGDFKLIVGQETPPFGWFSPAYGIKLKSGVLSCLKRGDVMSTTFFTAICVGSTQEAGEMRERVASL
jgi:hypothetical protein